MWCSVVTLFPGMFEILREGGITGRALEKGLLQLALINPRNFADNKHATIDDRPYGGGPGMVMQVGPLRAAIKEAKALAPGPAKVIYLSPAGKRLENGIVREMAAGGPLVLVAGRYEGIDHRVVEHDIDESLSLGDYVLSGGELAAMVVIDALTRWLPGALGDDESVIKDAFCEESNGILDHPHYTRPACFEGEAVPPVLLQGDHQAIARWRRKQALGQTWLHRRDLLENKTLDETSQRLLAEFLQESRLKEL